jgi:HTH-type transcriptional regulator/antitoxin HigA
MDVRPIKTEEDLDWALAEIAQYFERQPEPGTPEADRFDVLAELIGAYEDRHWPIEAPDPVEAIKWHMEMSHKKQADLATLLGSKSRASEILNRHRGLTLDMVHKLSTKWHIPADMMVRPYHLATGSKKATVKKRARAG